MGGKLIEISALRARVCLKLKRSGIPPFIVIMLSRELIKYSLFLASFAGTSLRIVPFHSLNLRWSFKLCSCF